MCVNFQSLSKHSHYNTCPCIYCYKIQSNYEEIERVLIEEQEQEQQDRRGLRKDRRSQQSQEANVIVKVSREQIEELSRHAKSSSRRSVSSESAPFNLRSRKPIYSNNFGNFFEITPEKNPQLKDLDILVNYAEIREVEQKLT